MKKSPQPSHKTAEMLAIQALAFIAAATGIAPDQIRDAARAPDFLAGVLEHMLADENLLVEFANSAGIDPAEIARAHSVLGKVWERDRREHELLPRLPRRCRARARPLRRLWLAAIGAS